MTNEQMAAWLPMARHALTGGTEREYRNHYSISEGGDGYKCWVAATLTGFAQVIPRDPSIFPDALFSVTEMGKAQLQENKPMSDKIDEYILPDGSRVTVLPAGALIINDGVSGERHYPPGPLAKQFLALLEARSRAAGEGEQHYLRPDQIGTGGTSHE